MKTRDEKITVSDGLERLPEPALKSDERKMARQKIYALLEDRDATLTFEEDDPLEQTMVLNMGPQHPATHGVLRVVLKLDGERVVHAVPELGYLHRAMEKLAENKSYHEFMPYTDRLDYMSPYSNNTALCLAVEKLAEIEVPERATYIRTIACELARISSHLLSIGALVMDTGALSVFLWTFQEREKIYDIFDLLTGARFTISHCRVGGIASDLSKECAELIIRWLKQFKPKIQEWRKLLDRNRIFIERLEGVGVISKEDAIAIGLSGPNLRASGVHYDIRRDEPYLAYNDLDFEIPTFENGDSYARYQMRMLEMEESVKIIEQALRKLPKGEVRNEDAKKTFPWKDEIYHSMESLIHDFMMTDSGIQMPKGEIYHAIEAPKGELGFYIQSRGEGVPWRLKIRSPSFCNLQALPKLVEGGMIADVVIIIGSLDPVMGEADK
ncbi:NADH dehydrogenase I, D subunit [Chloroherpeton thalassium ATCC 35110]|uniref:NADH-quinone oxidoreductase subunit D 1 n=2 Tax=Chloroherpeton thalassium TaxID=100716 RepID=NUOD1_CHLT3|nr:NADH dehydrogenase (quinone) subunit D [Chloroherpeton thalassium]B3QUS0.1 RecName: Full=NADH-quinone oxidoreductase subunit D 1; AltName: Full=NADH dehydrogenase I subunit D 1; AltName: Full=NDH-1 subunit D 1 [Chloroherpeton thalassium ATCC 35110]ACF14421.1 NADH dehydrogenase I, D subunit [Chloroherpeton thalassium ATCC 35110]